MTITFIEIFVRHTRGCPHDGEPRHKRCQCVKHIRWSQGGKQIRRSTGSRSWAGAERFKKRIEVQLETSGSPTPSPNNDGLSVEEAVLLYVRDKSSQNLMAVTLAKIRRTANRLVNFCQGVGRKMLCDITVTDLTHYRSSWDWYKSSQAAANEQSRLKAFFRYCHRSGLIPRDPSAAMSTIRVRRVPVLPFEPQEMNRIIKAVSECGFTARLEARVKALILLMRWSGLSIMDSVTLARDELFHKNGEFRVVTRRCKTGVRVNNVLPRWVGCELLSVPNSNPQFFFFSGSSTPKSAVSAFHKVLQKVFDKAGLPDAHPHMFRHTAAIELLKARKDMRVVSKFLGHKSLLTTEKYYSAWNAAQQELLDDDIRATWKHQSPGETDGQMISHTHS